MSPVEFFTILITLVGWSVTYGIQRSIQAQARDYQRKDRDIAVYRAHMDYASRLVQHLLEAEDAFTAMATFADLAVKGEIANFFVQGGTDAIHRYHQSRQRLKFVILDPKFKVLRDRLPERISKDIYDRFKANAGMILEFNKRFGDLDQNIPDLLAELEALRNEAIKIGDDLFKVADKFGDAFAYLDKLLASNGEENKPGWPRRLWEWILRLFLRDDYIAP